MPKRIINKEFLKCSLIALSISSFFSLSQHSLAYGKKSMECTVYGVQTVKYKLSLIDGNFFIDGERKKNVTKPNEFGRLVVQEGSDGQKSYAYAAIERIGGHVVEYAFVAIFDSEELGATINGETYSTDCVRL